MYKLGTNSWPGVTHVDSTQYVVDNNNLKGLIDRERKFQQLQWAKTSSQRKQATASVLYGSYLPAQLVGLANLDHDTDDRWFAWFR
jgi:hypothetical protein